MFGAKMIFAVGGVMAAVLGGCLPDLGITRAGSLPEAQVQPGSSETAGPQVTHGSMSQLEGKLRRNLSADLFDIQSGAGPLTVAMPSQRHFNDDAGGMAHVDQVGRLAEILLRDGPFATVQITGFAGGPDSAAARQARATVWANSVSAVFENRGWQRGLLHVRGESAQSVEGQETNEAAAGRVEIRVLPNI